MSQRSSHWVLPFLAAAFATMLQAQTTASLTASITDISGAVIRGAKVGVTSAETGTQRETVSNESGLYEFPILPPGGLRLAF